jgi:hypothetical protein
MTDTIEKKAVVDNTIPLKSICVQLKIDPYDARVKLRSADPKEFPAVAKHKAGHSWSWPKNSLAIKEVRALLAQK